MGKPVICKGDKTDHGGTVIEGHDNASIEGRAIAAVGHKVVCPRCRGTFPIIEGAATHIIDGRNTATDGMKTACGAALIASQRMITVE